MPARNVTLKFLDFSVRFRRVGRGLTAGIRVIADLPSQREDAILPAKKARRLLRRALALADAAADDVSAAECDLKDAHP